MRQRLNGWAAVAVAAMALATPTASPAAVVIDDNFSGDTVGGTPANYSTGGVAGGITLGVVDDANNLSTGGGNALSGAVTNSTAYAQRSFAAQTLAVGDSITVSFDVRISSPAAPTSGDRIFRWGLYNSTAGSLGFTGRLDTGTDANAGTYDIFRSVSIFNTATASGSASLISGTNASTQLDDNIVRHVTMTIARDGAGAHGTLTVQEGANAPVSIGPSTNNAAVPNDSYFTLDQFVIGFNGTAGAPGIGGAPAATFHLDNVLVTFTAVPEPGSVCAALGAAGLLWRRRRQP
jgi:hypothetical protein